MTPLPDTDFYPEVREEPINLSVENTEKGSGMMSSKVVNTMKEKAKPVVFEETVTSVSLKMNKMIRTRTTLTIPSGEQGTGGIPEVNEKYEKWEEPQSWKEELWISQIFRSGKQWKMESTSNARTTLRCLIWLFILSNLLAVAQGEEHVPCARKDVALNTLTEGLEVGAKTLDLNVSFHCGQQTVPPRKCADVEHLKCLSSESGHAVITYDDADKFNQCTLRVTWKHNDKQRCEEIHVVQTGTRATSPPVDEETKELEKDSSQSPGTASDPMSREPSFPTAAKIIIVVLVPIIVILLIIVVVLVIKYMCRCFGCLDNRGSSVCGINSESPRSSSEAMSLTTSSGTGDTSMSKIIP